MSSRALGYARTVVTTLKLERSVRMLLEGKASTLIMFLDPLLSKYREWMNHGISLRDEQRAEITYPYLYRCLAILFLSHSSCSFQKTIL